MTNREGDAYLDSVLIGGREPVTVRIVEYDEAWPVRFEELRARIATALGTRAVGVEHIGSTAVPGLAAKPVVDVLLMVAELEDESAYLPALEEAGFMLRVREPGHRMFRTPARDVHVHVYEPDDTAVRDYRDLREQLRRSPEDRELYASTKRELAKRPWNDMNDYADAKSEVIQAILGRARA